MALIRTSCSRERFFVAVTSGKRLLVATRSSSFTRDNESSVECHELVKSKDESQLKIIEFSPNGEVMLTGTSDKHITVWSTGDWSITTKRVIGKRGTAVQFTPDNKCLLMADKSGDVLRYTVPDLSDTDSLFLGHSSMLLDMVLLHNTSGGFVVTCDRDEKIRVSHFPNCYNIQTYCLGHTQLVSRLCKVPAHPQFLLSGSGDGSVILWDWYNGRSLQTQMCYPASSEDTDPQTVTGLVCSSHIERPLIVVTSQSHKELLVFRLSVEDQLFVSVSTVPLTAVPWCIEFDWLNRLWVCLHDVDESLQCYEYQSEKFCKVSASEEPILGALGKWEYYSDCVGKEFDWTALRKQEFDNMADYLAAKEDRIREQAKKSGQKLLENEEVLRPKPAKIAKDDK